MEREQLDKWCEKGILGIVLAILVFGPLAAGAVGAFEFLIVQGLTVCALVLWLLRIWIQENYRLFWPPICWAVIAFVAFAIIRYRQADIEYVARLELAQILTYGFLFLIVLNNLHRQESAQLIGMVLIFLGMALSLYAIYQFATNSPYVWHLLLPEIKPEQYMKRGSATYICPNHFAGFVEVLVPLALAFMFKGRFHHATKVFFGYASLMMLTGIAVSFSRGGWLAGGLALTILFLILVRYRDTRLPAIVFLTLTVVSASLVFRQGYQAKHRWNQFFRESGAVYDIRFYLWEPALKIWKDHFWMGAGPGHFNERFPPYRPEIVQENPGWVHNDYLNTLADWGVIGAALIAMAWMLLYWGIFKTWRFVRRTNDISSKPSSRGAVVLGGGVGLAAILFHSLVDFNMHIPANAILTITLMALVTGYLRFATERHWVTSVWLIRIAVTTVGVAGIAYLGQQGMRRFQESLLLAESDQLRRSIERDTIKIQELTDAEVSASEMALSAELSVKVLDDIQREIGVLKSANAVEPFNAKTTYRIGKGLRTLSDLVLTGDESDKLLTDALQWFETGIRLNPFDPYNYMRAGMCQEDLRNASQAETFFKKSVELDPNNYFVVAHYSWHFIQIGDYAEAKRWSDESLRLSDWRWNGIALSLRDLAERRLREKDLL